MRVPLSTFPCRKEKGNDGIDWRGAAGFVVLLVEDSPGGDPDESGGTHNSQNARADRSAAL